MTSAIPNRNISRRAFVGSAAGAWAGFHIVPRFVLGGPNHVPPSETVNVALVGAGGRGLQNARDLMQLGDVQITTVVDPAERWDLSAFYYKGVAGRIPVRAEIEAHFSEKRPGYRCREFSDFRRFLTEDADVDAVLCATPDHAHAAVSLAAMRAGKHVYCEKPLTHNIAEARLVARVARETGAATQMGNQGHANEGIRQTCEWIWGGAIGEVTQVHAWVSATRWNPTLQGVPQESQPVPSGLDWDLWLGPRAMRPFHSSYAPVAWRDYWDFGCGAMGDFGCHDLDAACWALDLHAPDRVEMHPAGSMDGQLTPYGEIGYFDFGSRGGKPPVRIHWYSGGLKPPRPEAWPSGRDLPGRGVLFIGDRGVLFCGGAGGMPELFPETRSAEFTRPEPTIPRSNGHHRDWIDAIKGGSPASSHFEYGARLTEITLLGVAALRTRKRLEWDAATMTAAGVPEAEAVFRGTYRPGWELT
ncbi:MAG: Gfo/Idh/MocA family protein [Planctomycetaceae bacterium]